MISEPISGIILAGGLSRRMEGKNKALIQVDNKELISYIIEQFHPQVNELLINTNQEHQLFQSLGFPLIADEFADNPGPMAGIHAGLMKMKHDYLAVVPCDCPCFPADLVSRLYKSISNSDTMLAVAFDGEQIQPTFCLVHKNYVDSLADAICRQQNKLSQWLIQNDAIKVHFNVQTPVFFNINRHSDLLQWQQLIK